MSKNERRLLATTGQIEGIATGIEHLAGDGMIPWLENRNKDMTMEHTPRWLQLGNLTYQAHTLQINNSTSEQIRWRLDKFKPMGTKTIEIIQRSELQVDQYTAVDPNIRMNYPRKQYPTNLTMHDGEKVLGVQQGYFGRASDLLEADEAELYSTLSNVASEAQTEFDRFRFEDILDAADRADNKKRVISMFYHGVDSVGVFGAQRALAKIRRLRRSAEPIERPSGLPE